MLKHQRNLAQQHNQDRSLGKTRAYSSSDIVTVNYGSIITTSKVCRWNDDWNN
jgi:hypothetical protein